MKVEAVHPVNMAEICPATVIKVFDNYYFLVAIDIFGSSENSSSDLTWLATLRHPYIFPVGKNECILLITAFYIFVRITN